MERFDLYLNKNVQCFCVEFLCDCSWMKNVEELQYLTKREHSHTHCIQINSDIIVTSPTRSSAKKAIGSLPRSLFKAFR